MNSFTGRDTLANMQQLQRKWQQRSHCHTLIFTEGFKMSAPPLEVSELQWGSNQVWKLPVIATYALLNIWLTGQSYNMTAKQQQRAICFTSSPETTVSISVPQCSLRFRLWGMKRPPFQLLQSQNLYSKHKHPLPKSIILQHQRDLKANWLFTILNKCINVIISTDGREISISWN